ncbi:L-glyceraldehyde 3-phosphate reductase [Labilibacter marinus]|uniref:L-glyceraldehyde 3-phosphate reductase n=1 Tax=Labilibacter marinus TaxID=1477105 RepID=UPI0008356603|nr:L-glyceraldehyde 3-phosphate reductase [Labilibacter marinus]
MQHQANKERYEEMLYQRCGRSGIKLPAISLGLWHNFGSVDVYENGKAIIFEAFDKGITHFDLANNYGPEPGSAEENFGSVFNKHLKAYRDEMLISTKAGYYMWPGPYGEWGSRKNLISSLDQSLKRMDLEYVDVFYSHRFDPETPLEETMMALDHAVRQGKALYAGISNYPADKTREAESILRELGTPCLIHQARYSMLDRWVEDELLDVVDKRGMGLIAFSPLAQGLLTNKYIKGVPEGSRMTRNHFLKEEHLTTQKLDAIKDLNEIAQNRNQSLAQMAIAWLLKDDRVTSVLVGASSVRQLNDSINSLNNLKFQSDELDKIEGILKTIK